MSHESKVPPGWYEDPLSQLRERLWDGSDWVDRTRSRSPEVVPAGESAPVKGVSDALLASRSPKEVLNNPKTSVLEHTFKNLFIPTGQASSGEVWLCLALSAVGALLLSTLLDVLLGTNLSDPGPRTSVRDWLFSGPTRERIAVPLWHEILHVVLLAVPTWWWFCVGARRLAVFKMRWRLCGIPAKYVWAALGSESLLILLVWFLVHTA